MCARHRLVIAALAAALASGCATAPSGPVTAPPPGPRAPHTITVSGTGKVSVKPDVALVQLGAEGRAATLAEATADVARRMTAVLSAVKALGVQDRDVTTVAYSVDPVMPVRRGEEEPVRIAGYRVLNVVQLRVRDLASAGRVLDAAVAAGANTMRGLQFTLDDPAKAQAEARARAVADAAAKAQQLAAAGGVRLGELLALSECAFRPVFERTLTAPRATVAATAPGPIETGELETTVTVEATYLIAR
jgi:uncharacterized protein YggE